MENFSYLLKDGCVDPGKLYNFIGNELIIRKSLIKIDEVYHNAKCIHKSWRAAFDLILRKGSKARCGGLEISLLYLDDDEIAFLRAKAILMNSGSPYSPYYFFDKETLVYYEDLIRDDWFDLSDYQKYTNLNISLNKLTEQEELSNSYYELANAV